MKRLMLVVALAFMVWGCAAGGSQEPPAENSLQAEGQALVGRMKQDQQRPSQQWKKGYMWGQGFGGNIYGP